MNKTIKWRNDRSKKTAVKNASDHSDINMIARASVRSIISTDEVIASTL